MINCVCVYDRKILWLFCRSYVYILSVCVCVLEVYGWKNTVVTILSQLCISFCVWRKMFLIMMIYIMFLFFSFFLFTSISCFKFFFFVIDFFSPPLLDNFFFLVLYSTYLKQTKKKLRKSVDTKNRERNFLSYLSNKDSQP